MKIVHAISRLAAAIVSLLVLASPRLGLACSVCSAGRDDESNTAFLISTIFLSVLPLAGLGTLVYVLWRRIQRLEAETPTSADAPATTPVGAAPLVGWTSPN